MTDHLSTFVTSIFKRCTSLGDLRLYVFPHARGEKALLKVWTPRHNLTAIRDAVEFSRERPGTVFSPPVALFGPLTTKEGMRTSAERNVVEAPVIALELDDTPTESRALAEVVLGEPTLVVRSGGVTSSGEDKLHLYWRLTVPARSQEERDKLKAIRRALAEVFNGDTSGVPLCHPMRWPGSWHTKGQPRLCEIVERSEAEVDLEQAFEALMLLAPQRVRPAGAAVRDGFKTAKQLSGEEASRLLAKIPNTSDQWDDWNNMGMAIFDATHGSDDGLAAFHEWSETNPKYDGVETDARWHHWFNSSPTDLSAGTLYHRAGEVMPRPTGEEMFGGDEVVVLPHGALSEPVERTKSREAGFTLRDGGVMFPPEQMDHFRGCVYVTSLDKVMIPNGTMLTRSRFDSVYGGHSFVIDNDNAKTTKSAWEAFTNNQRYAAPTADERCFRPSEPPMALIPSGNRILVNCYVPIETPRAKGDVSPFLRWLEKCYPEKRDRDILLNYMASLLQNPGRKFQWWPVLQSAEGTGKGFLLTLMEHCVGKQYCHLPNTSKMTRNGINFNGWIENKLFIGLNEIYSATRRDFLEELKSTVTDMSIPIEGKGIEEATLDNFANGFLFTNHQDGVPVNIDNRRYCVLFMALQSADDIARAGMTEAYFSDLWDWGFGRGEYSVSGFSIINEYLRTFPLVAELDPAQLAGRAPKSSTAHLAVRASLGRAEQEVLEAIEQGQQGFAGGWVSSVMLDRLLESKRLSVPRNKRQGMMKSLGYDYHPALPDGRVHNIVPPDGSKPRLYVKEGHLSLNVTKAADVARMYSEAQSKAMTDGAEMRLGA